MNKIAVFFSGGEPKAYPLSSPDYWQVYVELSHFVTEAGGQFFIVRGQDTYKGNGRFTNSWAFEGNDLKETGQVVVDVIYDKGRFERDNTVPVLNCQEVQDICVDKWNMYSRFQKYCPKTLLIENNSQLVEKIDELQTETVVYKPLAGAEGAGVKIKPKEFFLDQEVQLQLPGVLSEFLETSPGIPDIMEGIHDLRVAILDGELVYASYRTPPEGKLLANVAQGGVLEVVSIDSLPADVVAIAHDIDATMSMCAHRFYCIDFGYTEQGPKIIEMNSEMGLMPNDYHPVFLQLKRKLVRTLMAMG